MSVVLTPGAPVDLRPNAAAPFAAWAHELQARGQFQARGRGPVFFDCMGVVEWAQRQIGRPVKNFAEIYRELQISDTGAVDALIRAESEAWRNMDAGGVGDVVVLGSGKRAHHVAVLCGGGHAVHALETAGIVVAPIAGRKAVEQMLGLRVFGVVAPA